MRTQSKYPLPGYFLHPRLGKVNISRKSNAGRFLARWKNGEVWLTVPAGVSVEAAKEVFERLAPRLTEIKPASLYQLDTTLRFPFWSVNFNSSNLPLQSIIVSGTEDITFSIPSGIDISSTKVEKMISGVLSERASALAPMKLIPAARRIAHEKGLEPSGWKISRGKRVLGSCSSKKIISLSHYNMFLPEDLFRYIVCHELAHLHEMNHGPRFHEICNSLCDGNERSLVARLNKFKWPLLK